MKKVFYLVPLAGGLSLYMLYPTKLAEPSTPAYQRLPGASYQEHPNKHYITKLPKSIGVVGGGIAGAIVAKTLTEQGYSVRVFDRNGGPGGLWHCNYDSSGLQFPYPHYNLPDFEFPPDTDTLPKQDVVRKFTADYMKHFGVDQSFQFNTDVTQVEQLADKSWVIHFAGGGKANFDFLVMCTGPFNKPYVPEVKNRGLFRGSVLHSNQFIDAEDLVKGKKVLIVGSRKSALDIAGQARQYGAEVSIMIRRAHWLLPSNFSIFGIPLSFFVSTRFSNLFLYPFYTEKDAFIFKYCQPLVKFYWWLVTSRLTKDLPADLVPPGEYCREKHYIGGARNMDVYEDIKEGRVGLIKGNIEEFTESGVIINGKEHSADVVIFATGFQRDFLGVGTEWRYRNVIVPDTPNFAIVGMVNTYCNPLMTNMQAVWLAEVLRGRIRLPSVTQMKKDIEEREQYTLSIIHEKSVAPFSWFTYPPMDQLLTDMGLATCRKDNRFAYWTEPIKPTDYKLIVTHRV